MSNILYLIDGSGYIYRAFYAIKTLTNAAGLPTNALLGFTKMILKLLNEVGAKNIVVAFDTGKPTFRHLKYPDYKANRKACPPELLQQMPYFRRIVAALGIKYLEKEGFEADDIIGTVAMTIAEQKQKVIIVSGDKDLNQLVQGPISVWDAMKNIHYDREQVKEKFGIYPEQIVDYLALTGDVSDNIPGIKGVGNKTAIQLLNEFGTVDELLKQIDKLDNLKSIRGAKTLKQKILADLKALELSKELATIDCKVEPFNEFKNVTEFAWQSFNLDLMFPLFEELGFQSILKRLNEMSSNKNSEQPVDDKIPPDAEYKILTAEELPEFAKRLAEVEAFAFDTETTGLDVLTCQLVGISIAWEDKKAFYLPVYSEIAPVEQLIPLDLIKLHLGAIFSSSNIKKIGWNLKYDIGVMEEHGIQINSPFIDGMIAWFLLHPDNQLSKGLKNLTKVILGEEMLNFNEVLGKEKHIAQVAIERVAKYACHDADATWRLTKKIYAQLKAIGTNEKSELLNKFQTIEMPLIKILSLMERTGIKVDLPALEKLKKEFTTELKQLEQKIYALAGHEFNINSPRQLAEVLFNELKIPFPFASRNQDPNKQLSTDTNVLSKLTQAGYEIALHLQEYREIFKLQTTYVEALIKNSSKAHRVHSSFNQTQVATGRLSSSDPNLQNIPIRHERGARLRKVFIGENDFKLIKVDYSQIELRVLAHLSDDQNLIQAFLRGEDIHLATALDIFGEEALDPTRKKELRRYAKTINFGIVYGIGASSLAKSLAIPRTQAQEYIDSYFNKYPTVQKYFNQIEKQITELGYVETMFGRRRYVKELADNTYTRDPGFIKRSLLNGVIQGTAAEIVKLAMLNVFDKFQFYNKDLNGNPTLANRGLARLVLQVHDELVFEVHESIISEIKQLIIYCMENAVTLSVPLKVDVEISKTWGG
ncbi:MAG: DNA polymerase I [Deltaproteobacteria bacterium]|jgi:DNA polymerase-1|nr:DNA polymerase I [Deltaproteobacteria bacterium]